MFAELFQAIQCRMLIVMTCIYVCCLHFALSCTVESLRFYYGGCDLKMAKFRCSFDGIWVLCWRINSSSGSGCGGSSIISGDNADGIHSVVSGLHSCFQPLRPNICIFFLLFSLFHLPRFHRHLSLGGYYSHVRWHTHAHGVSECTGAHQNWMRLWWWASCVVHYGITNKTKPTASHTWTHTKRVREMKTWMNWTTTTSERAERRHERKMVEVRHAIVSLASQK